MAPLRVIIGEGLLAQETVPVDSDNAAAVLTAFSEGWNLAIRDSGGNVGAVSLDAERICRAIVEAAGPPPFPPDSPADLASKFLDLQRIANVFLAQGKADLAAMAAFQAGGLFTRADAASHRVPLSTRALAVLASARGLDAELVFPSPRIDRQSNVRQMSDTVFKALMDPMNRFGLTTHGFRSTFRDWCSAHADRELAEAALSHSFGSKVERAYARSDLFERRRSLMESWAGFATGEGGSFVQMLRK